MNEAADAADDGPSAALTGIAARRRYSHITDRAAGPARYTEDVDVIVRVGSRVEFYEQIERALRARGFKEDMREDAPICRWVQGDMTLDVMPTNVAVFGFTNAGTNAQSRSSSR